MSVGRLARVDRELEAMMDALLVLVLGMTGVATFLVTLVGVMTAITRTFPSPPPPVSAPAGADTGALVAVIQAAVAAYEADTRPTA